MRSQTSRFLLTSRNRPGPCGGAHHLAGSRIHGGTYRRNGCGWKSPDRERARSDRSHPRTSRSSERADAAGSNSDGRQYRFAAGRRESDETARRAPRQATPSRVIRSDSRRRKVSLGRLDAVLRDRHRYHGGGGTPLPALPLERGLEDVGDELKRRHVGPEGFERMTSPPPRAASRARGGARSWPIAGPGHERKRAVGVVVDRGIKLADDVVQHSRRDGERRPAVTAIARMTDPIARSLEK